MSCQLRTHVSSHIYIGKGCSRRLAAGEAKVKAASHRPKLNDLTFFSKEAEEISVQSQHNLARLPFSVGWRNSYVRETQKKYGGVIKV